MISECLIVSSNFCFIDFLHFFCEVVEFLDTLKYWKSTCTYVELKSLRLNTIELRFSFSAAILKIRKKKMVTKISQKSWSNCQCNCRSLADSFQMQLFSFRLLPYFDCFNVNHDTRHSPFLNESQTQCHIIISFGRWAVQRLRRPYNLSNDLHACFTLCGHFLFVSSLANLNVRNGAWLWIVFKRTTY